MGERKVLIRLRGLGGCLKTSLIEAFENHFTYLPGTTRDSFRIKDDLIGNTNNVTLESIISKYCQDIRISQMTSGLFITERCLMDYAFMNNKLTDAKPFDLFKIAKYEVEIERRFDKVIDFVIQLSDEDFITSLMSRDDVRSRFYGNDVNIYKDAQVKYLDFVGGIVDYNISHISDFTIPDMYEKLMIKVNEHIHN